MAKIAWQDKDGNPTPEKTFVLGQVKRYKIHPRDIVEKFYNQFKANVSEAAIRNMLSLEGISVRGLMTKAVKKAAKKPKTSKQKIRDDIREVKLQQKLKEVASKYQILVREKSLGERIIQVARDEIKALPPIELRWQPPVEKVSQETAVLAFGDTHLGEEVDRDVVCGFGEYNFDIFVRRLKFMADSIKSIAVKKLLGYKIDKLCIFGMGDMVSGRIHDELIINSEDIIFQILNGAYVTAQFILELSQIFPEIEIDGTLGNHGRIIQKKYYKRRYENWDYIFYQMLSMFLANNSRIRCNFPKSFFIIKRIRGWNFLILHGDTIRSWMGIPWYGIERMMWRLGDLLAAKGIKVHYRVIGHFHNTGELDKVPGELIINGSVIGGTEHSLMSMMGFERPTQLFFGVHKEIGMTWRYPLRLDLKGVDEVEPYGYNQELDAGKYMRELLKRKK